VSFERQETGWTHAKPDHRAQNWTQKTPGKAGANVNELHGEAIEATIPGLSAPKQNTAATFSGRREIAGELRDLLRVNALQISALVEPVEATTGEAVANQNAGFLEGFARGILWRLTRPQDPDAMLAALAASLGKPDHTLAPPSAPRGPFQFIDDDKRRYATSRETPRERGDLFGVWVHGRVRITNKDNGARFGVHGVRGQVVDVNTALSLETGTTSLVTRENHADRSLQVCATDRAHCS
jgi:hypothetical protein